MILVTQDSSHMNRTAALFILFSLVAGTTASGFRFDRTKDIVYKEIDGKKLKLNAYVPKGDGPFPTVLVVHGGAWRAGSRTQLTMYAKSLARRGYCCFAIDYRLAPQHKSPGTNRGLPRCCPVDSQTRVQIQDRPRSYRRDRLFGRWPPGFATCHHWPVERGRPKGHRHKNHRCSRRGHTNRFSN